MIAGSIGALANFTVYNNLNRNSNDSYGSSLAWARRQEDELKEYATPKVVKPKNVLSIDIDALFNGHTYAKYMNYDLEPNLAWKVIDLIASELPEIDLKPDPIALNIVAEILNLKCSKAKIHIIEEHDEIIDTLRGLKFEKVNMYNIDAHHDITYGNEDNELTIENWVRYAKSKGLIDEYNWLHRPNSDIKLASPMKFKRDCLHDASPELFPEFDAVVICVSKHFTPKQYWITLPNVLLSQLTTFKHFQEVHPNTLTEEDIKAVPNYEDYLADGTMPNIKRLFRDENSYLIFERDYEPCLSMISLDGKANLFHIKEVVDYLLGEYKSLRFDFVPGIRNEIFIKRLVRNYEITDSGNNFYKIKKR